MSAGSVSLYFGDTPSNIENVVTNYINHWSTSNGIYNYGVYSYSKTSSNYIFGIDADYHTGDPIWEAWGQNLTYNNLQLQPWAAPLAGGTINSIAIFHSGGFPPSSFAIPGILLGSPNPVPMIYASGISVDVATGKVSNSIDTINAQIESNTIYVNGSLNTTNMYSTVYFDTGSTILDLTYAMRYAGYGPQYNGIKTINYLLSGLNNIEIDGGVSAISASTLTTNIIFYNVNQNSVNITPIDKSIGNGYIIVPRSSSFIAADIIRDVQTVEFTDGNSGVLYNLATASPLYTLTPSGGGKTAHFELDTSFVQPGTTLAYTLSGQGLSASNVGGSLTGSLTINKFGVAAVDVSLSGSYTGAVTMTVSSGSTAVASASFGGTSTMSASNAIAASQAGTLTGQIAISDNATNVAASLDGLQSLAANSKLSSISLTDGGIPIVTISSAQAISDASVLQSISGNFSVTQTATGSNLTINGVANALGNTVVFNGTASQYTVTPAGDGVAFTVSTSGSSDHLSNVQALQFSDLTIFATQIPSTSVVTTGNVTELYGAVFGHQPSAAGLAYYLNVATTNPTLPITVYAQWFLASPEYTGNAAHNYAANSNGDAQFINDCFQNLLHRSPLISDVTWYQNNVIAPFLSGLTPGTTAYSAAETLAHAYVITDFSASQEFLNDVQVTLQNPPSTNHWLVFTSPTYVMASDGKASISEGGTETFSLSTTGVAAGTSLTYTLTGVTASEVVGGHLSGTVTVGSDGSASLPVTLTSTLGQGLTGNLTATISATSGGSVLATVSEPLVDSTQLRSLFSFSSAYGTNPGDGLISDAAGNLFGTTLFGGATGSGTVFEIAKTSTGYASTATTLISFNTPNNPSNGANTYSGLIADATGNLFGTTINGGASGFGTVFEIAKTSTGYASTPTSLISFNSSNGKWPMAALSFDSAGNLFGTTQAGGASGNGTVFEIAKTSTGYAGTPTSLASFSSTNGSSPDCNLITDAAGNLLGTTQYGGAYGNGTVFEIAKTSTGYASTLTSLVSFSGSNGSTPIAGLIADASGNLFGTTQYGGSSGNGTVFEIAKTSTGYASTPTTLVSFSGSNGQNPHSNLILDAVGNLFGTTYSGGANGLGEVFEIAKTSTGYSSAPTVLASFNTTNGASPYAGLIADTAGNLFSTTYGGGASGAGTVFELTGSGFAVSNPALGTPVGHLTIVGALPAQSPDGAIG